LPRSSVCPKCQSDAVKRTHRQGLKERLSSLFFVYPYRCRKCSHRFLRFRSPGGSTPKSGNKTHPWQKRRREMLLYGLGILLFLALLSFMVRERNAPSDGN
jgi:hypothetical protein